MANKSVLIGATINISEAPLGPPQRRIIIHSISINKMALLCVGKWGKNEEWKGKEWKSLDVNLKNKAFFCPLSAYFVLKSKLINLYGIFRRKGPTTDASKFKTFAPPPSPSVYVSSMRLFWLCSPSGRGVVGALSAIPPSRHQQCQAINQPFLESASWLSVNINRTVYIMHHLMWLNSISIISSTGYYRTDPDWCRSFVCRRRAIRASKPIYIYYRSVYTNIGHFVLCSIVAVVCRYWMLLPRLPMPACLPACPAVCCYIVCLYASALAIYI